MRQAGQIWDLCQGIENAKPEHQLQTVQAIPKTILADTLHARNLLPKDEDAEAQSKAGIFTKLLAEGLRLGFLAGPHPI